MVTTQTEEKHLTHTDNKEKSQYNTVADVLQSLKHVQHLDI